VSSDDLELLKAKLLSRIEVRENGCWEWMGARISSSHDHGYIWWKGDLYITSRVSWMVHRGPIPDGMFVCHHCDNPPCVNPEHLFLGTPQDNTNDMIRKGRQVIVVGENGRNVLTEEQVWEIDRLLRETNMTPGQIAKQFKVSSRAIRSIRNGECWSHLKREKINRQPSPYTHGVKLDWEQAAKIKAQIAQGKSNTEIAKLFGVHRRTIADIKLGNTWHYVESAT